MTYSRMSVIPDRIRSPAAAAMGMARVHQDVYQVNWQPGNGATVAITDFSTGPGGDNVVIDEVFSFFQGYEAVRIRSRSRPGTLRPTCNSFRTGPEIRCYRASLDGSGSPGRRSSRSTVFSPGNLLRLITSTAGRPQALDGSSTERQRRYDLWHRKCRHDLGSGRRRYDLRRLGRRLESMAARQRSSLRTGGRRHRSGRRRRRYDHRRSMVRTC